MKESSFVDQIAKLLIHRIHLLQISRKERLSPPFPHMRRENGQKKELARKQITKDRASQVEIREVILSFFSIPNPRDQSAPFTALDPCYNSPENPYLLALDLLFEGR